MCKALTTKNTKCKLEPTKNLCYKHVSSASTRWIDKGVLRVGKHYNPKNVPKSDHIVYDKRGHAVWKGDGRRVGLEKKCYFKGSEPSPKGLGHCAKNMDPGSLMRGKDGRQWIVVRASNGSKRWVRR